MTTTLDAGRAERYRDHWRTAAHGHRQGGEQRRGRQGAAGVAGVDARHQSRRPHLELTVGGERNREREVLGRRWRLGAAAWSLAALIWLVLDWAINHEDIAFHAVVAVLFAGLVAVGAGAARLGRGARAWR